MKKVQFLFLLFCFAFNLNAQDYYVQVAVYDKAVPVYQFSDLESRVFYAKDTKDFHRYYIGKFTKEEADTKAAAAEAAGRRGVEVVDGDSFGKRCACGVIPVPREMTASLRSIFFDFDRYNLRPASRERLNELLKTLRDNPSYRARLMAHTDAKGSNEYNERLSLNRANAAKNYLTARGIASSRIDTQTFGETDPIAKNELADGSDTEAGRQFNRRVELLVLNAAGEVLNMVEDINVPTDLQN